MKSNQLSLLLTLSFKNSKKIFQSIINNTLRQISKEELYLITFFDYDGNLHAVNPYAVDISEYVLKNNVNTQETPNNDPSTLNGKWFYILPNKTFHLSNSEENFPEIEDGQPIPEMTQILRANPNYLKIMGNKNDCFAFHVYFV